MKIKEKTRTATEENVLMILNCEPVTAAAGSTVVGLGIISPLHQNMDWGNEVMSHRTDRVSLTPLGPPLPHPLYPPPHREVRGRPLELVAVSGQVQNPLGIHIEPSWCFCHVTERRSDPSITSVEFTAGAADHITNGHQPGEPETEPQRLFWIICRIQESVGNFSSVKSLLLTFCFLPPPRVSLYSKCLHVSCH